MSEFEIGMVVEDLEKSGGRGVVIAIEGSRVQIAYDIPQRGNIRWRESVYVRPVGKPYVEGE